MCSGDSGGSSADQSKMEVSLTLTSRFDVFSDQDQSDSRGVLLRCLPRVESREYPPCLGSLSRFQKECLCLNWEIRIN